MFRALTSGRVAASALAFIALLSLPSAGGSSAGDTITAPESSFSSAASGTTTWGQSGLVVSDSERASRIGRDVLRAGGNAVDGAVAAAFALTVTFPWAGPIGGGGFAVVHLADGSDLSLDFREVAPAGAQRDMYLDEKGEVAPGRSLVTALAVGVPGTVDGLIRLWQDHGSGALSLAEILAPSIRLARDGFVVGPGLAKRLEGKRDYLSADPAAAAIFVKADHWRPGDRLRQRDLARTLQRIAESGRAGFYEGPTSVAFLSKMQQEGGIVSREDLLEYRAVYRTPVRGTFRQFEVVSMGPPSSGGLLVLQMLAMFDLAHQDDWEWNSVPYLHLLTELQRRAYADRSVHLGDPDFWNVPMGPILDPAYLRDRVETISWDRATPSSEIEAGSFTEMSGIESDETTHLAVVDEFGNAVSMTVTLNGGFGSGRVVAGTGVLLNNEMDDFSARPGSPNLYGLVGNEANAIAPRKRMLSSMSPTLVLEAGEVRLVLGSPGGSRIINAVLQVLLNHLHFRMPIDQAVAAPRMHAQWLPDKLFYESRALAPSTRATLRSMGHELEEFGAVGRVNAIARKDGIWWPAPDPRGDGMAAGY